MSSIRLHGHAHGGVAIDLTLHKTGFRGCNDERVLGSDGDSGSRSQEYRDRYYSCLVLNHY